MNDYELGHREGYNTGAAVAHADTKLKVFIGVCLGFAAGTLFAIVVTVVCAA